MQVLCSGKTIAAVKPIVAGTNQGSAAYANGTLAGPVSEFYLYRPLPGDYFKSTILRVSTLSAVRIRYQ